MTKPKCVHSGMKRISCPREFVTNHMMCLGRLNQPLTVQGGVTKFKYSHVSRPPLFMHGKSLGTRLVYIIWDSQLCNSQLNSDLFYIYFIHSIAYIAICPTYLNSDEQSPSVGSHSFLLVSSKHSSHAVQARRRFWRVQLAVVLKVQLKFRECAVQLI